MTLKTERIEARVEPDVAERIRLASQEREMSVSSFIVAAAVKAAETVLESTRHTLVTADYFTHLLEALDAPGRVHARLADAAAAVAVQPVFVVEE